MIEVNKRKISQDFPPYIIAELSANHSGSINRKAKNTIEAAKKAGADAIKIQTYTADTMTINCDKKDFIIKRVYGRVIDFTIYIKKRILLLNGIKNYLNMLKRLVLQFFHLHLMNLLLIY